LVSCCDGSSVSVGQSKLCHTVVDGSEMTRLPVSRREMVRAAVPPPLVVLSHTVVPLASSRARPPSRRNEILEPRPFTGAPGFAVQTAVFSAAPVYQMENEKAFSPASWKPHEKVPSGDVRNGRARSSTDREEPAPTVCCCADTDGRGTTASSKMKARQVLYLLPISPRDDDGVLVHALSTARMNNAWVRPWSRSISKVIAGLASRIR